MAVVDQMQLQTARRTEVVDRARRDQLVVPAMQDAGGHGSEFERAVEARQLQRQGQQEQATHFGLQGGERRDEGTKT